MLFIWSLVELKNRATCLLGPKTLNHYIAMQRHHGFSLRLCQNELLCPLLLKLSYLVHQSQTTNLLLTITTFVMATNIKKYLTSNACPSHLNYFYPYLDLTIIPHISSLFIYKR